MIPKMMLEGWTGAGAVLVPTRAQGTGQETEMKVAFYAGGEFVFSQMFEIWQKWTEGDMSAKNVVSAMMEIQGEIERYDAKPQGPCQMSVCAENVDGECQKSGSIEEIVNRCGWNISIESSGS